MLEWIRFAPPASQSEVAQFESKLGMRLPEIYRRYLLSYNGGQPCSALAFKVGDGVDYVMLGCLYSLCNDGSGVDLIASYEELEDDLPIGFLPVGDDPGGNPLLLSINGEDSDSIHYWDRIGFFVRRLGRKQFRVANNIEEFLASVDTVEGS